MVDLVAQRLALGRAQYGPLQVDNDSRDWEQEALEELLDATIYLAAELLRRCRIADSACTAPPSRSFCKLQRPGAIRQV